MTRKKLKTRISECEKELQTIKTLPYYDIFKQKVQQQADIAEAEAKLKKLKEKWMRLFDSFVDSELHSNALHSSK